MKVGVIEDQRLVRDYLVALVRRRLRATEVVAIGSMAELRAREAELADADLILLDVDLGDGTTVDWAVARQAQGGSGALVALSSISGVVPYKKLQEAAISLVHKDDPEDELVEILRRVLEGGLMLSRRMMELISTISRDPRAPFKLLSRREQQVLAMLGQRFSHEEIASVLGCALATVGDHRKRIMRKLGLHSIEDIIDYAIRHGLIHDSTAAAQRQEKKPDGA